MSRRRKQFTEYPAAYQNILHAFREDSDKMVHRIIMDERDCYAVKTDYYRFRDAILIQLEETTDPLTRAAIGLDWAKWCAINLKVRLPPRQQQKAGIWYVEWYLPPLADPRPTLLSVEQIEEMKKLMAPKYVQSDGVQELFAHLTSKRKQLP